jgi:hypothetical protein
MALLAAARDRTIPERAMPFLTKEMARKSAYSKAEEGLGDETVGDQPE